MTINVVYYGALNNCYATIKNFGYSIGVIMFFDTGNAYAVRSTKRHDSWEFEKHKAYNTLKFHLEFQDFKFITPIEKVYRTTTELSSIALLTMSEEELNNIFGIL